MIHLITFIQLKWFEFVCNWTGWAIVASHDLKNNEIKILKLMGLPKGARSLGHGLETSFLPQ
jgi:hypothetical protein